MANKIIFIGLIVALLQVASAEEANPEPYMDDVPLAIYVDAGREIDRFLSLAKSIDGKQSVLEDALERMSAEIKATEERCTQKVSKLEKKLKYLISLQTNGFTLHKRAELACLKTYDLQSAGIHNNTKPYIINFAGADGGMRIRGGVLIEKRFVLATIVFASFKKHDIVEFSFSDKVVSKKIKKVHFHPFGRLILFELDSDVDYNYWLYPTCLYTSELNPNSDLMHDGKRMKIAEDSNCYGPHSTKRSSFEICVDGGCGISDHLVFLVEEETAPQLFGLLTMNCYGKYRKLRKVFPDLDFIENIVWPKNGN